MNRYYSFDTKDLDLENQKILTLYNDFGLVLDSIKQDRLRLGPELVNKLNLPELDILGR